MDLLSRSPLLILRGGLGRQRSAQTRTIKSVLVALIKSWYALSMFCFKWLTR